MRVPCAPWPHEPLPFAVASVRQNHINGKAVREIGGPCTSRRDEGWITTRIDMLIEGVEAGLCESKHAGHQQHLPLHPEHPGLSSATHATSPPFRLSNQETSQP